MRIEASDRPTRVQLERSRVISCEEATPIRAFCESGLIWLTVEGDPRDLFLKAGDSAVIPAGRHAVLEAKETAALHFSVGFALTGADASTRPGHTGAGLVDAPAGHGLQESRDFLFRSFAMGQTSQVAHRL